MALYLPAQHLALDIVDDPRSLPAERDAFDGVTVVPITRSQLAGPGAAGRIIRLCAARGVAIKARPLLERLLATYATTAA